MAKLTKRDIDLFFAVIIISLVGNAVADFALLWYGLSRLVPAAEGVKDHTVSFLYVGKALGAILLAPLFSIPFDRFPRLISSIALDVAYGALLLTAILLYKTGLLTAPAIFIIAMLISGLALVHTSSVGYAAIQRMSDATGVTGLVSRYVVATIQLPALVGTVASGFAYHHIGLVGCLSIGILTFLPTPFIYYRVFRDDPAPSASETHIVRDIFAGAKALRADEVLFGSAVTIGILNIGEAVLPSVVGVAFLRAFPGRTDYAAIAIAVAILGGILAIKPAGQAAKAWPIQALVPLSLIPSVLALALCLLVPSPFFVALLMLCACLGSAVRNVSTGSLRVTRVPRSLLSRVNTVYGSILYLGQTIGGVVIVGAVQHDVQTALGLMLCCLLVASGLSIVLLPSTRLGTLLEAAH
jgi:hypothetical protein